MRTLAVAVAVLLLGRPASGAEIPPEVRAAASSTRSIWVFLHGKGPAGELPGSAAQSWISPRAAARCALRGGVFDPMVDRPIYDPYRRALTGSGFSIRAQSRWFNAVAGTVDATDLDALAGLSCVDSLRPVALFRRKRLTPTLTETWLPKSQVPIPGDRYDYGPSRDQLALIQVDQLHAHGLDGDGVRIGFLDTGYALDPSRIPVFDSLRLVAKRDFINNDTMVGDNDYIQMAHGTATLSLCGGFAPGALIGVAPRAEYVVAKTEIDTLEIPIEESYWVAGLEWEDSLGCDLVSSSLGYTEWYTDSSFDGKTALCTKAAELAAARGLLVVNAAGNEGCAPGHIHIIAPADGDSVLTVGATNLQGEKAAFSSCGPTFDGRTKPDVVAPGDLDYIAFARGGFGRGSGTSFATPLVSGVCALLLQQNPSLKPYDLIERLRGTATHPRKPLNTVGWGLVQAAKAANLESIPHVAAIEAWPNPADSVVTVTIPDADLPGTSVLQVFTVSGQLVYATQFETLSGQWRGLTDQGRRVAPGVYLLRVKTRAHDEVIKVAWRGRG